MNQKLNAMENLKSSEQCNLKTTSARGTECELTVGEEIVLDLTGSKTACVQEHVSTFNNKLPQKNSGYEKKSLKICRIKPQMLGNLTFREIAEKRKEMLKIGSVERTESNVPSLTSIPAADSSLKHGERDEEQSLENTTFINPHMLVGKTITLEQGGIRHIKFLSQDLHTSSNKNLLKLDALQLTPKIIVRKSKQGLLPSNQIQRNCKDLSKINYCQKMSEHVGMHSDKNLVELCVQPRLKSLPHVHSLAHESEIKELARDNSELLMEKCSNRRNVCNYGTDKVVDIQREREENVTKCTLLNSSHDNLTILSQVACGELEMNNQLESKEVTKKIPSVKDKIQDSRHNLKKSNYVSLDHSYQQKHQPSKGFHCYEHTANVKPMKPKTCIGKIVENISKPSSEMNKRHFEEKPMFAWCTQYITYRTLLNINDCSVAKKYELPSNQERKCYVGNKMLPTSLNSNDNFKSQHNCQNQDHPFKSDKISKKTLHFVETSKESVSLRTPHAKEIFKGTMPQKSQLFCENEDRKDSLIETAEITVETFFSSKEKLSEMNDEVLILKEILVTKSPSCNVFKSKDSDISKLKNSNNQNLCATSSRRSTLGISKTSLVRTILTEIPANEEETSKLFHKNNDDHNVSKLCTEVTNNLSQTTSKDMTGNEKIHEIINIHSPPLKSIKDQPTSLLIKPEESHNYTRECISDCTTENITADSVIGKTSYPIKKCSVLVERLNEPTSLVGEVSGISSSMSSTNVNEIFCDCVSPNNCAETNGGQREVCMMHNFESKFRDKGLLTTSSDENIMVPELNKVESEDVKPLLPFIRKCKTNSTNNVKTNKINVFNEKILTSKELNMPIESHIDNNHNHSEILTGRCFQEKGEDNNSVACQGNYNNFEIELNCEEMTSHPENSIGDKRYIALGNHLNSLRKRKLKVSVQGSENFIATKKAKLPCQKSKKLAAKNVKTGMKKDKNLKTKPDNVKVKTEYKKGINNITKNKEIGIISYQKSVEVPISNMNGKMVKRSPEKTFSGNREIYSLLTDFTTLGCSIEPERKLRRRSANNSQKSAENIESLNGCAYEVFSKEEDPTSCNQVTKNNAEMQSKAYTSLNEARFIENNNKSKSNKITPLKQNNVQDNLEESLDTAGILLVHPALSKSTPKSAINNSTPVIQRYSETVSNQNRTTQDDVQDLQIDYDFFPPTQQNILKCDKLHSDHIPSQSCNKGKSPDIVSGSKNRSSRPKRLKQLKEKNVLVSTNLSKEKTDVRELKRKCLLRNVGTFKRKPLELSRSDIEKNQDNVKIKCKKVKSKSNRHTLQKCSSTVNNLIKLPSNSGKKNSAARNRLQNKPSVSNMEIKKVISTFSDHRDSENLPTSKLIQELKGNLEESIQPNNQRCSKISCYKINELKNGSSLSAKVKQLKLSRQMRQHSQTLGRLCLLNSKQECLDSTDVALHIQANNLKYANKDTLDDGLLLADSSKSSLEFSSLTNCSVSSLDIENKPSMRVRRRPSLSSQSLKNKYSKLCTKEKKSILSKSKSNPLTSNNRKFVQKVTKGQDISINQVYCSDLSESNSIIGCVQKQEFSDSNELLNQTVISCKRLNKPTLNLPIPVKTSQNNNLSTAPSINMQPSDSNTCINKQDKLSTKVKCGSNTSNSRQERVKPTNNLIPHPSTVRDKIRLLIMEQLKRSRLGSKIALEKAPPKR